MYKGKYTPLLSRQITFAIYDDMMTFFGQRLRPGQFVAGVRTEFPMSLLSEIISSVRYQNPVMRPNFPKLWEGPQPMAAGAQAPSPAPATGGGSRGGGTGGGTGGRGHDPSVGRGYDPVPPRFEGQGYEMRKQKWLPLPFDRSITHVHPIISAIMGEYWELCQQAPSTLTGHDGGGSAMPRWHTSKGCIATEGRRCVGEQGGDRGSDSEVGGETGADGEIAGPGRVQPSGRGTR
eukprot:scaffold5332_cov69-Cyclotella_meneghiniana.AAC.2